MILESKNINYHPYLRRGTPSRVTLIEERSGWGLRERGLRTRGSVRRCGGLLYASREPEGPRGHSGAQPSRRVPAIPRGPRGERGPCPVPGRGRVVTDSYLPPAPQRPRALLEGSLLGEGAQRRPREGLFGVPRVAKTRLFLITVLVWASTFF